MYKLFERVVDGLETIRDCVSGYLRVIGKGLVEDCSQKSAVDFIQVFTFMINTKSFILLLLPLF